jgi:hypothetical protein
MPEEKQWGLQSKTAAVKKPWTRHKLREREIARITVCNVPQNAFHATLLSGRGKPKIVIDGAATGIGSAMVKSINCKAVCMNHQNDLITPAVTTLS